MLDLWNEEAPGKYCRTRRDGYESWGDLVKDQATCQAQCELDSQCIGIAYSHESPFEDWCFICPDDELSDFAYGFGFYRRLGITFTVILLYLTVFPIMPFLDFKTLLFHIGISTSAPTTTAQSSTPESTNHGMIVMIVI